MTAMPRFSGRWSRPAPLRQSSVRSDVIALMFVAIGVMAIISPLVAALTVTVAVGWILVLAAFANAVSASSADGVSRVVWQAIVATLYFVSGLYFLLHPALGLRALTLLLASVLFAEAVSEAVAFAQAPRDPGAPWLLVNGVLTTALAMMILMQWPSSAQWAIGSLLGINLMLTGFARLIEGAPTGRLIDVMGR
jgi:uncharacterized membrane protein HdeD (DUF308 family)